MPLQFNTRTALETDLLARPGIYGVDKVVQSDTSLDGFVRYDMAVIKELVDKDGTSRYQVATQQIIEDLSDNSFGYGSNVQWGNFDKTATTFADEVNGKADDFEGTTLPSGATVIKVTVSELDERRKSAKATAYLDDKSTISALIYKDSQDAWQRQIL